MTPSLRPAKGTRYFPGQSVHPSQETALFIPASIPKVYFHTWLPSSIPRPLLQGRSQRCPPQKHWFCDKSGLALAGVRDEVPGRRRQGQGSACPNSLGRLHGPFGQDADSNHSSSAPTLVVPAGMQRPGKMWLKDGTWQRGSRSGRTAGPRRRISTAREGAARGSGAQVIIPSGNVVFIVRLSPG